MNDFAYEGKDLEAMSFAPKYHVWILSGFRKFLGKKVAEVGAGTGNFSSLLVGEPIEELVAVEPSKEMFPLLAKRFRQEARVTCKDAFFSDISAQSREYFDSVVYISVLEHIKDDEKELQQAHESLKQDGTVCIFVPALQWLFGEHDRSVGHQRRYYRQQMKDILEKTGFEVVSARYFDIVGVLPWFVLMRVMKRRLSGSNAAWYDAYVVPIMSKIESLVPLPFGKNLVVVGRKIVQR